MKTLRRIRLLFWFSAACFTLMSATVLLMPLAVNAEGTNRVLTIITGSVFWISALAGHAFLCLANQKRKWLLHYMSGTDSKMNSRPGIITVFSNIPATVSDVLTVCSLVLFVIHSFAGSRDSYLSYVLLFALLLSFHMHCLFNGRIYKATKIKSVRRRLYE